jgi:hypothetical protein
VVPVLGDVIVVTGGEVPPGGGGGDERSVLSIALCAVLTAVMKSP